MSEFSKQSGTEVWAYCLMPNHVHPVMVPADEDYLISTVRYVERNPVVAGLCDHPEDWKWSSTRAHLKGEDDRLTQVKPMLDRIDRWNAYLSDADKSNDEDLIARHTRTGRPLGSANFVRTLEITTGEKLAPKRPGSKPVIRK